MSLPQDYPDLMSLPQDYPDLLSLPQDYPDSVAPGMGQQLERLGSACRQLTLRLLAALDAALGSGQLLVSCHQRQLQEGGNSVLRVLHYPPVPDHLDVNATRCSEHTDYGTMTLLLQNGVSGLEVGGCYRTESPDWRWVAVTGRSPRTGDGWLFQDGVPGLEVGGCSRTESPDWR